MFDKPKEAVWKAITQIDLMEQWYFDNIGTFEPQVGFKSSFDVHSGERVFPHRWTVTEVVPGELISYDWAYDGYEGLGNVTFALSEQGDQTVLDFTMIGIETFENQDVPEFTRESCQGGWDYFLKGNLKQFLDG